MAINRRPILRNANPLAAAQPMPSSVAPRGSAFTGPPPESAATPPPPWSPPVLENPVKKIVPVDLEAIKKAKKDEALRIARIKSKEILTANAIKNAEDAAAKAEEERPKTNEDFDKAASDMLLNEINQAGNVDTKAEEALINEQMNDRIGAALVAQRASMGRSGFGSSGALAAMEGDTQRTARQQGLEDVLGLRRTEDQRATDNAVKAIGSEMSMRKQAKAETKQAALLKEIEKGNKDIEDDDDGPRSNPNAKNSDLDPKTRKKLEAAPERYNPWMGDRHINNITIEGVNYEVYYSNDPNGENDDEGNYLVAAPPDSNKRAADARAGR